MKARPDAEPRRIVVHSLDHARAAVAAAAALGVPLTLMSAPGAAGYAGPLWFKALVAEATRDCPDLGVSAVLDCGDEPGTVLAALRAGIKQVRFAGPEAARARLAAIAQELGATIESGEARPALDLLDAGDPARLCIAYLAGNKAAG